MISVMVIRSPGDKQGPAISDAMIVTEPVARERGRNAIDSNFSHRKNISSNGPYQGYMRQGRLIEIADSEQLTWRGIIRSCTINVVAGQNSFERTTSLIIEREA